MAAGTLQLHKIVSSVAEPIYRISGHESFACRYTWLPKAARILERESKQVLEKKSMFFSNEEKAMVELGVGKNMVRSIRFWIQATGIVDPSKRGEGHTLNRFGLTLFGENGHDPFLEDIRTLWLLHWNLSTAAKPPLLAWDFLLNRWQDPELTPSLVIKALQKEAARHDEGLSQVTIDQHWDTFLHSYFPTRGRKGAVQEDNLDSPLTELELIIRVGERPLDNDEERSEPVYAFRREQKNDITQELFVYALNDFWKKRHNMESTLTFREIAHGYGSPGQIFKLPEDDVRARVEQLEDHTKNCFSYAESSNLQQVIRQGPPPDEIDILEAIYLLEDKDKLWAKNS